MGARMGAIGPMSALTCLAEVAPLTNGSLTYVHDVIYGCGVYCAAAKRTNDDEERPSRESSTRSAVRAFFVNGVIRFLIS